MDPTTLRALAEFPRQLEAHFSAIPTAFASWEPASWVGMPSEPFSAIEQLCHVRDIEVDGKRILLPPRRQRGGNQIAIVARLSGKICAIMPFRKAFDRREPLLLGEKFINEINLKAKSGHS